MARKKKNYSLGLRTRAGLSVRKRWARIESDMRSPHKCPSCTNPTVRRLSSGVWGCSKCGHRFTGGAYVPSTKIGQSSTRIR